MIQAYGRLILLSINKTMDYFIHVGGNLFSAFSFLLRFSSYLTHFTYTDISPSSHPLQIRISNFSLFRQAEQVSIGIRNYLGTNYSGQYTV